MAEAFYHGPEIIEHGQLGGIVRDVRSAVIMIVGTASLSSAADAEARKKLINKRLVVRSVKQAVQLFGPATGGHTLIPAIQAVFGKVINGQSGGTIIAVNVFDPDKQSKQGKQAKDGEAQPATVSAADIIGGVDKDGNYSGLQLAYGAYNELGFFPKILITPGFGANAAVRAAMDVVAKKVRAVSIADLPAGILPQDAVKARGLSGDYNMASDRMIYCYPQLKAYDEAKGDIALQPYSQHFAGVIAATDLAYGYHYSPSNKAMGDIVGMELDIPFIPGDYQCEANDLNAAGIVTIRNNYGSGFCTWGNRSSAFPGSVEQTSFIQTRRVLDIIHESALFYLLARIDAPGTAVMRDMVQEDVNAFIRSKVGDGVLYGGQFAFDNEKTTPQSVADGRFYYTLTIQPVAPMERITVNSYLDIKLAQGALGLAA